MTLRELTRKRLETRRDDLVALSHSLHAEPELAFEEHKSAAKIADLMEDSGFDVTRGVCDLPTAFTATYGTGDLVIGITAEYDALPGMGHACGHNVNGASAVAAALALAPVADELGLTVKLLGTPAEEGGGGKVYMLERGAFDDVAAAMMVHAAPIDLVGMSSLAISAWNVAYTGREAHAAVTPHLGVNAADAMMVAQVAIGAYRQQMHPSAVVSGIVTDGGQAPNVIPGRTAAHYECRAATLDALTALKDRIRACFEAGALATGATLTLDVHGRDFADLRQDATLTDAYRAAAEALGRTVTIADPSARGGSTDMGNISHVIPTVHPLIGYDCGDAMMHNPDFTRYGTTSGADKALLDGGLAMAWAAVTLAEDPATRTRLVADAAARTPVSGR